MRRDVKEMAMEEQASVHMAHSIREAFCGTIRVSGLPPMAVLEIAAMALGLIYQEAAAVHDGRNGCPCGWRPDEGADIESLRAALAIGAVTLPGFNLRVTRPLGRA
jgi:hypothetical protein